MPYKYVVASFLGCSLLASILDGISIGLLVPLLSHLQGSQPAGTLPRFIESFVQLLQSYSLEMRLTISMACVVSAVLAKNILIGCAFRQGVWLSNRVCADIRSKIVRLLLTVGIGYHHKAKSGELLDKAVNYTQFMKDLFIFAIQFVVFLLIFLILFALMFILSWQLTLIALFLGTVAMTLMSLYLKSLSVHGGQQADASRRLTSAVQENLSAIHLIQANCKEEAQLSDMRRLIEDHMVTSNHVGFRRQWVQPITEGLGIIVIALLLLSAYVILPQSDALALAQLLPFLYILLRAITTLKLLNDCRGNIKSRWPYARMVYELVQGDDKPLIADGDQDFAGLQQAISFSDVTFSYDGEKTVLEQVDFSIPKGKTTAIVGKSGSGKSTVINLLLRFYDPEHGVIHIDEQRLKDLKLTSYRERIGIVSQDTFIFHDTVRYNIAFGTHKAVSDEEIVAVAQQAGADGFIRKLPKGYDTVLGDRGVTLSGGQRQRLSIARALLKNPEILILDEATSALDAITEQRIHKAMQELQGGRTTIIIAHRLSTIKNADQIVVLKRGRVSEMGSPQELLDQGKDFLELIQAQ